MTHTTRLITILAALITTACGGSSGGLWRHRIAAATDS